MKQKIDKNSIDLIVYDFDGVMTNNKVILLENGMESVIVNRGDGLAIGMIKKLGIKQIILSTEQNVVVKKRAEKLNVPAIHSIENKKAALMNYCEENCVNLGRVAFVGNDINDYEVMCSVGLKICPNDAEPEIIEIADIVLDKNGGDGVVRELARYLL